MAKSNRDHTCQSQHGGVRVHHVIGRPWATIVASFVHMNCGDVG
jgi:hypothetical protein